MSDADPPRPLPTDDHDRLQQALEPTSPLAADSEPGTDPLRTTVAYPAGNTTPAGVAIPPGYQVLGVLGRGGMGVVYEARHVRLDRVVALKMILSGEHAGAEVLARFQTEARAVARLQHPGIVQVFEVGEHGGLPFFSLEFCAGGSLADTLRGDPWPARRAAETVEALARAMQHAHDADIVHRDLKPANVLLTLDGRLKVTDFGLAKRTDADSALSRSGTIMGTPSYMAPEQALGKVKEVGPAADLWALGAVLYELLLGRPPFRGATVMDTLAQVVADDPVPPSRLAKVPRDLETICLKCLHKEPKRRYGSMTLLAEDLGRYLRGEPVQARPVGRLERGWRWCRRNPAVAALLAAVVLLLVVGTGVSTVLAIRANNNFLDAEQAREKEQEKAREADVQRKLAEAASEDARNNAELAAENEKAARRYAEDALRSKETAEATAKNLAVSLRKVAAEKAKADFVNYAFQFRRAADAVAQNRLSDASSILDSGRQQVARGWEDAYLRSLLTPRLVYDEHAGPVTCVACSPDGRRIATGSASGEVRLLDATTGRTTRTVRHAGPPVRSLAFHPDGTRIVSADGDAALTAWNTEDGTELLRIGGHEGAVRCVAYSADGSRMVSGSADNTVRIWEAQTGKELQNLKGHTSPVNGVAFSPDGGRLVSGSASKDQSFPGGILKVWDARTGKELLQIGPGYTLASGAVGRGHRTEVLDVKFSPDGRQIASAASESAPPPPFYDVGQICLWDAETGDELLRFDGSQGAVSVAFDSKGRHLVGGTRSGHVRMWDARTGRVAMSCQAGGDMAFVGLGPDDSRIVAASRQTVSSWDARAVPRDKIVKAHAATVTGIALSRDGKRLVSSSEDTTVKVFDFPRGEEIWDFRERGSQVYAVGISPDGRCAASGNMNGEVTLRDLRTSLEIRRIDTTAPNRIDLYAVVFHPDGTRIATGDAKKQLRLWDVGTGRLLRDLNGHPGHVLALAFSTDGTRIVSGDSEGTVKVWEEGTGKELLSLAGAKSPAAAVAFSHDGKWIAAGVDKVVRVWDASSGEPHLALSGHAGAVRAVRFSPDGLRIASGSDDRAIKLWDVQTGEEALTIDRDGGGVRALEFSSDGRTLYSGNGDGTIRAFHPGVETAPPGSTATTPARTFKGRPDLDQAGPVLGAAYSPDGSRILSGGGLARGNLRQAELWSWNATTEAGFRFPGAHRDGTRVLGVACSPDDLWSATVGEDSTVRIRDRRGRRALTVLGCESPVCVEFSPDGNRLAVGTVNEVRVWEKQGDAFGPQPLLTSTGHTDRVLCVAYSPDGTRLASGSADRTIRVCDAQSGRLLQEIANRAGAVTSLAFGPDGRLLSGHADGSVRIGGASGESDVVLSPFQDHVSSVRFSRDGLFMIACSWDGTVRGWNAENAPVFHLDTRDGRVGCLALSPDGERLLTGQWNGRLHEWSLKALLAR